MEFVWGNWLVMAFLAPAMWALVNIVDVYLVGEIYEDELDGTIISGIFQIVPGLVIIFLLDIPVIEVVREIPREVFLAVFAGMLFASAYYFYFLALANRNDVALVQVLWNLGVVVIPVLAFLMWKDVLPACKYLGILIVLAGAALLSGNIQIRAKMDRKFLLAAICMILVYSLSLVIQEGVYRGLSQYGKQGFWIGFVFFSFGGFLVGILFAVLGRRNPYGLILKYGGVFVGSESLQFLGTISSQRAIDISPSVSFVAAIETFVALFVVLYSWLIIFFARVVSRKKSGAVYNEQLDGGWMKILAALVMAAGVYIIS